MNDEFDENTGRFKLDLPEDIDAPAEAVNADELRLEKISQRVTFISILIPVLIIIVLVITYLDVKKRVSHTEDTGTMEFQKLSADLESRFSGLSLRQAKLEEALIRLGNQQNQSSANSNVKLDQLEKSLTALKRQSVSQKAFDDMQTEIKARAEATGQQIKTLSATVAQTGDTVSQTGRQIGELTQSLETQIEQIKDTLAAADLHIQEMEAQIADLDKTKMDEPAMDVKVKLAALRIQQNLNTELEAITKQLKALQQKIAAPAPIAPKAAAPSPPAPPAKSPTPGIQEQTITP